MSLTGRGIKKSKPSSMFWSGSSTRLGSNGDLEMLTLVRIGVTVVEDDESDAACESTSDESNALSQVALSMVMTRVR